MKFSIIALALLLQSVLLAQSHANEEKMEWKEDRPLQWKNFKGTPQIEHNYVASTNSGISFSFSSATRNGKKTVHYDIKSYFYPESSWFMENAVNDYILKHEQTHFDISELFARKLRKALAALDVEAPNYRDTMQKVYQQNEQERSNYQQLFDWETNHSTIATEEARWEQKVAQELKEYEDWQ